jgi:hypothetical protein
MAGLERTLRRQAAYSVEKLAGVVRARRQRNLILA